MSAHLKKVILAGGAGLVGQNLTLKLKNLSAFEVVVIDKHRKNLEILRQLHPGVTAVHADLAEVGDWGEHLSGANAVVMLQAQIGGNDAEQFIKNNLRSTENVLNAARGHGVQRIIHVSSSVVESVASDDYSKTKAQQEEMVRQFIIPSVILRPTLMFGWFDRKHLGWLSRFMQRVPVFPIPGDGRYARQPLYAGDFSEIVLSCLMGPMRTGTFNISGMETVDYLDMIKIIRAACRSHTRLIHIPIPIFHSLLWAWSLFDRNPPFTTQQLKALTAGDRFEVIDWPEIFEVNPTPFAEAVKLTFEHPLYSSIKLDF